MTVYYVDNARPDDTGNGLSLVTAKKTIAAAITLATGSADIVDIAPGTYTLTTNLLLTTSGTSTAPWTLRGTPGGAYPIITSATNSVALIWLQANYINFEHLTFTHTATTRGHGIIPKTAVRTNINIFDCTFDGCLVAFQGDYVADYTVDTLVIYRCSIINCISHGIANGAGTTIIESVIRDNGGSGFNHGTYTNVGPWYVNIYRSVIARNVGTGVDMSLVTIINETFLTGNTIRGNGGHGIASTPSTGSVKKLVLDSNIIYGNGGRGVIYGLTPTQAGSRNAYGANGLGDRQNVSTMPSDIILTEDPHVDATGSGTDFRLNDLAGGVLLKSIFVTLPGTSSTSNHNIGAIHPASGAGGTMYYAT